MTVLVLWSSLLVYNFQLTSILILSITRPLSDFPGGVLSAQVYFGRSFFSYILKKIAGIIKDRNNQAFVYISRRLQSEWIYILVYILYQYCTLIDNVFLWCFRVIEYVYWSYFGHVFTFIHRHGEATTTTTPCQPSVTSVTVFSLVTTIVDASVCFIFFNP